MISPSDNSYIETKQIKLGHKALQWPFNAIAEWVQTTHNSTKPINVLYDWVGVIKRPRLEIVFERLIDQDKMSGGLGYIQEVEDKKREICEYFKSLIKVGNGYLYDTDDLFCIFTNFEQIARWEANIKFRCSDDFKKFIDEIKSPLVWKICGAESDIAVFYNKYENLEAVTEHQNKTSELFSTLFKEYDEFEFYKNNLSSSLILEAEINFIKWCSQFQYFTEY